MTSKARPGDASPGARHAGRRTPACRAATAEGMRGLRGTDNVGFTVPDLDEAVRFVVDVIGGEPFHEPGPFASDGDRRQTQLDVPRRTMSPQGMQHELMSFPQGKGCTRETSSRLWHPARPAD